MDEHWMPMSEMCSVCSPEIEYDFIIKFENLAEEERYLIRNKLLCILFVQPKKERKAEWRVLRRRQLNFS